MPHQQPGSAVLEVDLTQESDDGPMDDDDIHVEEVMIARPPTSATVTVASAAAAAAASIMDLNRGEPIPPKQELQCPYRQTQAGRGWKRSPIRLLEQ